MNKPTSFQNITSWAKNLATIWALAFVLNGCGEEKKAENNLQNEVEKGKMEVILNSKNWKMVESPKSNIDNNKLKVPNSLDILIKTDIYDKRNKEIKNNKINQEIYRFKNLDNNGFSVSLKYKYVKPNADNRNIFSEELQVYPNKLELIQADKEWNIVWKYIYENSEEIGRFRFWYLGLDGQMDSKDLWIDRFIDKWFTNLEGIFNSRKNIALLKRQEKIAANAQNMHNENSKWK